MKKGQGLSINTLIYLLVAVIVLVVVILLIMTRMRGVQSDLDEKSEEYKNKCEVAGAGRLCALSEKTCTDAGGSSLGRSWTDCKLANPVCCQY